jgi:ElaB/YqjD/DUF883 family membrane-anchored ribosome-binding protein
MDADQEKLIQDVRMVVHDAEELIKATAGDFGDKTREARAKLAGALVVVRETCNKLEKQAIENASNTAKATDAVIRSHPYESAGIALGAGLLIGVLLAR